ncbi:MAG: polymer-forming cytoskeletal protein [Coriobacteriales bacterium]|jgi:cytoskeletal protein CcmA (bactofilin family)|nr:polymer-forming cytoskeletal protein [Coriobacteriales bacterium]
MDENTDLTEGVSPDSDESTLEPEATAENLFTTPVSEPAVSEPLRIVQSLWPDTDSVTPAPVSASSPKPVVPTPDEPDESPEAAPAIPLDTVSEHVPATSLIEFPASPASPAEESPAAPTQGFEGRPAPDPRTRITSFTESKPLVESKVSANIEMKVASDPVSPHHPSTEAAATATAPNVVNTAPSSIGTEAFSVRPAAAIGASQADIPAGDTNFPPTESSLMDTEPATPEGVIGQTTLGLNGSAPLANTAEMPPLSEVPTAGAAEAGDALPVAGATAELLAVAPPDYLAPEAMSAEFVSEEPVEVEEEPVEKGISVITREATVLGDIITEGHIDIVGRVKGNIDAKGDVAIHGIVRGDVDGSKIGLYSCRVKGNLNAGLGVIVDDNSIIGGDVKTKNIIFDGKVKGNIDADNVVVLRSHSYCLGDVSAASLAVEPGAILNGKIRTFVEGDLEAPFDEVM